MEKRINLKQTAKKILVDNQYLSLATVDVDGGVWATAVAYAVDDTGNLYFISLPDSRHSRNIEVDHRVVATIFDSRQLFGEGVGLQIEGEVKKVLMAQTPKAIRCYFGRKWPYGKLTSVDDFKKFYRSYKYRLYRLRPTAVWMNDPRKECDSRVKVKM